MGVDVDVTVLDWARRHRSVSVTNCNIIGIVWICRYIHEDTKESVDTVSYENIKCHITELRKTCLFGYEPRNAVPQGLTMY